MMHKIILTKEISFLFGNLLYLLEIYQHQYVPKTKVLNQYIILTLNSLYFYSNSMQLVYNSVIVYFNSQQVFNKRSCVQLIF